MGDLKNAPPSRKVKAFLYMALSICLFTALTTWLGTPDQVTINALYIIGAGGLFTIGGQSLVDSIGQWAAKSNPPKETP